MNPTDRADFRSSMRTRAGRGGAARAVAALAFIGAGAALAGCPIYDDSTYYSDGYGSDAGYLGCSTSYDCANGYSCVSHTCSPNSGTCSKPNDCSSGSTCGADGYCHDGTCSTFGCVSGSTCTLVGGQPQCVPDTSSGGDSGVTDSGPAPECTSNSTCVTSLGTGAKCLNGSCVAPANQCSDGTQCAGTSQCVDGTCTPSCDSTHPCPTGYACDAAKGVCTGNSSPCTTTAQCSGGNVCVESHCVAPCSAGSCGAGLVCTAGGCVPDQKPVFVCQNEGAQGAAAATCAAGSICIHHSCYIACSDDAGADAGTSCKSADKFNVCKPVQTGTGTYSVCGSTTNLGTECDPTQNKSCSGGTSCIDGFCR